MVASHYQTEESRLKAFIGSLDKGDEDSFYDPIKKNKLDFFQHNPVRAPGDLRQKILKDERRLFSKLCKACQLRECDLKFFHHAFSDRTKRWGKTTAVKSLSLLQFWRPKLQPQILDQSASAIIVDGLALINTLPPRAS